MSIFKKLGVSCSLLFAVFAFFLSLSNQPAVDPESTDHALVQAINTCDGITERAAAHLVAVVEFQRLEIVGRKARVFKQCMDDRAYVENTQWLTVSTPMAEKTAKVSNISLNEALENMRRADMVKASGQNGRPVYWTLR